MLWRDGTQCCHYLTNPFQSQTSVFDYLTRGVTVYMEQSLFFVGSDAGGILYWYRLHHVLKHCVLKRLSVSTAQCVHSLQYIDFLFIYNNSKSVDSDKIATLGTGSTQIPQACRYEYQSILTVFTASIRTPHLLTILIPKFEQVHFIVQCCVYELLNEWQSA